ncbi:DNA-directed RNA polymerase subunit beta' [Gemmatimonadota bacterium]
MVQLFSNPQSHSPRFSALTIQLASPEAIRGWSFGEVTKPETINYRSFKPEKDGLFCERIFGPVKDWECHCGKYKRIRYRGVICDRCGVEVTQSRVRRERMGHIELAVPVSHIWYFKSLPSTIGYLLSLTVRDLERVLYYESYLVLDPGNTELEKGQLLAEEDYRNLRDEGLTFVADMGAPAVKRMLDEIDVDELSAELRTQARIETSQQRKKQALKRLKVVEAFRHSENNPAWMILDALPVIPPDLRPLVPLDGGRFATSDLNDLYRRVINRNNRLKKLIDIKAPEVILRNEKRMLQEAVDALLDNGRRSRAVRGTGSRALKSLSDLLKGKQGRFRQNLLGKRVDYSGRSVIVVGPELKMHQCGLPKTMALELYKPFIIRKLEERGLVQTIKGAKKLVERERPEVWDILEEIIKDHPVLLNRAPTLHRLGIQAFQPVLVEGKAIRLHPLVCVAFNADFDGDQMAVHVPLSFEANLEARMMMLATHNVLSPAHGRPITIPTQDMVLGIYYMTKSNSEARGKEFPFASTDEAILAYHFDEVDLHGAVKLRIDGQILETTVGRILFNEIVPEGISFVNETLNKKSVEALVGRVHRLVGNRGTVEYLDRLKDTGFKYATLSGTTVGIDDILIPPEKEVMVEAATNEVERIQKMYSRGIITDSERYNMVIDVWTHTTSDVSEIMFQHMATDRSGFNPVYMMADSGARGSKEQIRQLAGMRGLMAKPQKKITGQVGEIIENPIIANFREGLSVLEYFISTHGARKGLADTALKTADAGYLTRRLVDVAQDGIITEDDCGTIKGIYTSDLKEGEEIIEPMRDRILGRVVMEDIRDKGTGELILGAGEQITESVAERIEDTGIETILIRSVLTCESRRGICQKCYGRNLATGRMVNIGEAVGVMAAQSIGEPGTQLTLRTFHIGGTASRITAQSEIIVKQSGRIEFKGIQQVEQKLEEGSRTVALNRTGKILIKDDRDHILAKYNVPYGASILVKDGQDVEKSEKLYEWDPYSTVILTEFDGQIAFKDISEELTVREKLDEQTGSKEQVIIESRDKSLTPKVSVVDGKGKTRASYVLPTGSLLQVKDGQKVTAGAVMVKIPREISKTRDITGGLPRVAELFEARKPKEPAVVTEIDGVVKFGGTVRGAREVFVEGENETRTYKIPYGKHILVHEGDFVEASERLSEGSVNPHDILGIMGVGKVQEYLVNEIQEVYRLQGVAINDKHIQVIVRQMLQKVRVVDPGDSALLEDEIVDRFHFQDENSKTVEAGGSPATFEPVLLGITNASITTESWISAASFQETTRVLTDAAIRGKTDGLLGLKENVIVGQLIPAGTGVRTYRTLGVYDPELDALGEAIQSEIEAQHEADVASGVLEAEKVITT